MPTFRVKNLSVTLGETAKIDPNQLDAHYCVFPTVCNAHTLCGAPTYCLWPTNHCDFPTIVQCWTHTLTCLHGTCGIFSPDPCGPISDGCGVAWSTLPPTTFRNITPYIKVVDNPDVLEMLHGQMEEAMAVIKERGVQLEEVGRPQTLADAELLEKELKDALSEVQKLKKGMK